MKRPHWPAPRALALATAFALAPAWADTPADALRAADPATPAAPVDLSLPAAQQLAIPDTPQDIARAREIWRQANERVAEFPRGHIDLLRWEAANPAQTAPAQATAQPELSLSGALRQSLRERPDLFTHAGMSALEKTRVGVAYAAHVRELQHAWIDAVAMRQRERHANAVLEASQSGTELGRRMVVAGNWAQAQLMNEQLSEAAAWQAAAQAAVDAHNATERLARLLGLWSGAEVQRLATRLPGGLPALPASASPAAGITEADIEAAALRADPMLTLRTADARLAFNALPAQRWADWARASDEALQAMPDPAAGAATPPHIGNQQLLRDHSLERAATQRAELVQAAAQRRSMARQAWAQVQLRHASALHAERVVSGLQEGLKQDSLLRYNGMLQSTWQLLARARERVQALDAALMARRDYWRAQASWQALLAGADFTPDNASTAAAPSAGAGAGH